MPVRTKRLPCASTFKAIRHHIANQPKIEKPVGLVFIALASEKKTEVEERNFPGDRKRVRFFASQLALDMIRRKLM